MLLRAFLRLHRARLLGAAIGVILLVAIGHMTISADGMADIGIFWHHFCGCAPQPGDAAMMLSALSVLAMMAGFILGLIDLRQVSNLPNVRTASNSRRFLLTRPVSRLNAQLYPLAIALAAVAVLPVAAGALLLGWLKLVHAPSLGHLIAALELIPAASQLGPHPSLMAILHTLRFGRRYIAALSVGVATYTTFAAIRWFFVSPRPWLRNTTGFFLVLIYAPVLLPREGHTFEAFLLISASKHNLSYIPSTTGIALHFLVAAAFILATGITIRESEL